MKPFIPTALFVMSFLVSVAALAVPCPETLACPAGATLRRDAQGLFCEKAPGKPHGPTVQCRLGKLIERQMFRNGLAHGPHEMVDSTGRLTWSGTYVDGKVDGVVRVWHPGSSQLRSEANMVADQLHGTSQTWHINGQLASTIVYVRGLATGVAQAWHANGNRAFVLNYRAGKEHGEQQRFHETGTISEKSNRRDGVLHGEYQSFTATGELHLWGQYADDMKVGEWVDPVATGGTTAGVYVAGKQHGPWKVYNPSGRLVALESFDHGRRHGVWTVYGANGAVAQRDTYDDGMKTEACTAQQGKLRCTNPVPYEIVEIRCEFIAGDGMHDIRSASEFRAAYTCTGDSPTFDWTKRRL